MCYIAYSLCGFFTSVSGGNISRMADNVLPHDRAASLEKASFIWRPKWFLLTRFLAAGGVIAALVIAQAVFHIETIRYPALWTLFAVLVAVNVAYTVYYRFSCLGNVCENDRIRRRLTIFTIIQITIDLILLTLMLHFSGGATNPFILYYFFHTMLASILLSKEAAYLEAVFAAGLFSAMTLLEGFGIVGHYTLLCPGCHTQIVFMAASCFALSSALIIAVYLATSIMERLRFHQQEVEHALHEMERLEAEKSRFLDVVAHDLKSPLASIETMVTSNLAVYGDEIPPQMAQTLRRIPIRTGQLLSLIQELLDFSRITNLDEVTVEYKELNFLPIVTTTVEMYMTDALKKNIQVSLNAGPDIPSIRGNKNQLERMVGNLVSNAVRYTPENGSVNVKVVTREGNVVLTVADTGIGIPDDAVPKIFSNFYRATNARRMDSSGTGLGLSITRTIVEKHGGSITFTSTEGEGTVFTVTLPALRK